MKAILLIVVLAIVSGVLPIVYSKPPSNWRRVGLFNKDVDDSSSDQDGDEVGERQDYNNHDENDDSESDENDDYIGDGYENDDSESDENDDYIGDGYDENDDSESDENDDYIGDDYENDDSESDENDDYIGDDYENDDSESDENDDYIGDGYENDDSESDENDDYNGDDSDNDEGNENDDSDSDEGNGNDDSDSDEDNENDYHNGTSIDQKFDDQGNLIQAEFQIDYLLYTRQNSQSGDLLQPGAIGERFINGTAYRGTIFIFHGFMSTGYAEWVQDMKDELLLVNNFNVIVVNWRDGAVGPLALYYQAVRNTVIVGQRTANLIQAIYNQRGIGPYTMHLIGHSLGAHCAGFTGKIIYELIGQRLSRISGLDPAGPLLINYEPKDRLHKTDAYFVDIIHTNDGKLGWEKNTPLGHVDFYPNGGSQQPGCTGDLTDSCAHDRAMELYIYSIRTCPFLTRPGAALCPEGPDTELQMGYHSYTIIEHDPALFCLETTGTVPYCDKPPRAAGPTVFPAFPFRPDRAAWKLRKAVAGVGTDEAAIIDVVNHHTYEQREEIEKQYKTIFKRDLRRDLRSDLSGAFEYAVLALFDPPRVFDAKEMRRSLKGVDTDEDTLIEILSSRSNDEIDEIKQQYRRSYDRDMDNDIRGDTSRDFEDLLISLSAAKRDDGPADPVQARRDAEELHEAGDERPGTDEKVFTRILSSRSFDQLKEISKQYKPLARRTLTQSIKRETSGDLEDGYLAIVKLATNTPAYFAKKLYHSMRGPGTNNKALVRLVVSRNEIDMKFIKEEFQKKYSRSLESAIKGDTSRNFEKLLLALID